MAAAAGEPQPTTFNAVALADTIDRRGDSVDVRSDTHLIRQAHVDWLHGVRGRIPGWTKDIRVAVYVLVNKDDERVTGSLWANGRPNAGARISIALRPRNGREVAVTLRGGARPGLDVTKLPAGTRSIEINTVGGGRDVLRVTAPCRDRLQRVSTRITVTLGDTSRPRIAHRSFATSCGGSVPREP